MHHDSLMALRETKYAAGEVENTRLDGSFSGYASIFNEVDLGKDCILPGAFAGSLERRGAGQIRMLFQHDPNEPIGVWQEVRETAQGLYVRGRLTLTTERGREIHELMRAGAIDGLSIGFRTIRARQDKISGVRKIVEADLWEISVVTFPMQETARVGAVKSGLISGRQDDVARPTVRQFERWLVRDAGLSRSDARLVITNGYRHALERRDAGPDASALAGRMRAAAANLLTHAQELQ